MGDRRNTIQSRKRIAKALQDEMWDCSVCTYTNSPEAFKCAICDVRKGTSTRKPRLSQHIVAQQEATRLVAQMPQQHSGSNQDKDEDDDSEDDDEEEDDDDDQNDDAMEDSEDHQSSKSANELTTKPTKLHKPKLKGIDRSSPVTMAVTVNNVTVMFTEYSHDRNQSNEKTKR